MNRMKTVCGCLLASVLAASLLVSCGKKDWQPEVDRAVKAYEEKRYDEAVPVFVEAARTDTTAGNTCSACAMNGGSASKRITRRR